MFPVEGNAPPATSSSASATMTSRRITRASAPEGEEPGTCSSTSISTRSAVQYVASSSKATAVTVTEEMVSEERDRLLRQKQTQLDQTFSKHDDLVREKFHMENWKSMLGYDPRAAKADESQVFRDYKSEYDLLRTVEPAAGLSRRTRRAVNERKSMIESTIPSISVPPLSASLKSPNLSAVRRKPTTEKWEPHTAGKGKEKETVQEQHLSVIASRDKGKDRKAGVRLGGSDGRKMRKAVTMLEHDATEEHTINRARSQPRNRPGRSPSDATTRPLSASPEEGSVASSILVVPRRRGVKRPHEALTEPDSPARPTIRVYGKSKPHKLNGGAQVDVHVPELQDYEPISSRRTARQTPTIIERNSPKTRKANGQDHASERTESPQSPSHGVKRIKLIVRKPTPTYTNPWQRPDRARYNHSLTALISSFVQSDRSKQMDKEARTREREAEFRRTGRFIPGTDVLFGTKLDGDELPPHYEPPKRETKDHWDHVIDTVVEHRKFREDGDLWNGKKIAAEIAEQVEAYWEIQSAKRAKIRLQEEKKLKALAKATIKAVVNEWKRAVHHIREQERLREEEEERRKGQEHLELLLDQSGQLLSTQKSRLRRRNTSSRASSISERLEAWGQDSDDESDTDQDSASQSAADSDEEETIESESGLGSSLLLMNNPPSILSLEPFPDVRLPEESPPRTPSGSQHDDDSSSVAELDHLMIPDPETSPIKSSPTKTRLVDYASSSGGRTSPECEPVDSHSSPFPIDSELSKPPQPHRATLTTTEAALDPALHGFEVVDASMRERDPTPMLTSRQVEMDSPLPEDDGVDQEGEPDSDIPAYLRPYAVAPVEWDPSSDVQPPLLLRGTLRPYQQAGLEWLANLHTNNLNGILADEMGLGKTIQTIALLAHLACDRGIWGPHLIIVPTSVILNWEMEFKKFLPGFKVLSYHGGTARRKELRKGWMDKFSFNVCITSYALASRDQHIFKRKNWYYMILDEAHMIKNFKSQRWNVLLMFRSFRRLLLTGTPLQNNLTELWALLQFLMSGSDFANLKEFGDWFSNPLEKAIEMGQTYNDETLQVVSKLHTVLRPYLLRRLKRDVEKELPTKYDHLLLCPLSKRQRFLYDEFMSRAQTRQDLESGVYQKIANILMQLRKVCNHPDLFEVRPIVTSFAMRRSAVADFEIKELLIRKRWIADQEEVVNLDVLNLDLWRRVGTSHYAWQGVRALDGTSALPYFEATIEDAPPKDTRTTAGFQRWMDYQRRNEAKSRWTHIAYLNALRCNDDTEPTLSSELLAKFSGIYTPILPLSNLNLHTTGHLELCKPVHAAVMSVEERAMDMGGFVDRFAFATPAVVAVDIPRHAIPDRVAAQVKCLLSRDFDSVLHRASVKLQIAFPDPSLLQYDCGKLQMLAELLREKREGGHRVLIFTQMTRILDILEIFLNFHGYLYLRLDGATKIEDRQYITERFNADSRVFCFISSSRSGGVGINLTGADTVVFYDSDFNPQMDRQCEDRAHRIGQIRDVHIYRLVSEHTVEEAMLIKANQKRTLDDIVIQKGEFDWGSLLDDENALTKALGELDEAEDAHAAALAQEEAFGLEDSNEADFGLDHDPAAASRPARSLGEGNPERGDADVEEEEEEGGTTIDYMVEFVERDWDFFQDWRI